MSTSRIRKAIDNPKAAFRHAHGVYHRKISNRYLRPLYVRLGNQRYGNFAGLKKNFFGDLAIRKNKWLADELPEADEEAGERFREKGFVELGQIYDEELVDTIRRKFEERIEDDAYSHAMNEVNGSDVSRRIDNDVLLDEIPEIAQLLNEQVRRTLESYYGTHFQVLYMQAYRTYHVPEDLFENGNVFSNFWHADGKTTDHVKLFVTLQDTDEDDGPLHLISKDVVEELPDEEWSPETRANEVVTDDTDVYKFTGPAGNAVFGNTQTCLHRAGNPADKRDLLYLYFAPAAEPLPENWAEEYEPQSPNLGEIARLLDY